MGNGTTNTHRKEFSPPVACHQFHSYFHFFYLGYLKRYLWITTLRNNFILLLFPLTYAFRAFHHADDTRVCIWLDRWLMIKQHTNQIEVDFFFVYFGIGNIYFNSFMIIFRCILFFFLFSISFFGSLFFSFVTHT